MVWLHGDEKFLKISLFVLTECTNVTDTQTDRRTPHDAIGRACIASLQSYCSARYTVCAKKMRLT